MTIGGEAMRIVALCVKEQITVALRLKEENIR